MEGPHDLSISHPVLACAGAIGGALDEVAGVDPLYMTPAAKAAAMVELSRVIGRAQGLLLRVLATADDVALDAGARSAAAWLAHETRVTPGAAVRLGRLGEELDARWHRLADAVWAGGVNLEQAHAIATALGELPDGLDDAVLAKAEAHLVAEAAHFDAAKLRILGRKVLEVVAPEVAEDHERRRLEEEERRARETTRLSLRRRGDGTTDLRGRVPDAVAGRLRTYLEALASPRRGHLEQGIDPIDPDTGKRLPHEVLLGRAFGALLEALPAQVLPAHGGGATTVVVTIDFDRLKDQVGAAELSTGDVVSASEAMRLACTRGPRPRRPRRPGPAAAPRPGPPVVQQGATPRHGDPRRALPRPRVRPPRRLVRGPPQARVVSRREDRPRRRRAALSLAPPPRPRPRLRHRVPPHRRRPIHPADLDVLGRAGCPQIAEHHW